MANSADPDQLASSDLHCLQNRVYPGSAGQGLKNNPHHSGSTGQEILLSENIFWVLFRTGAVMFCWEFNPCPAE